jgi:hypothetical protein
MEAVILTKGGRKKLGNLGGLKNLSAREAIRQRGGGQQQVNQLDARYADLPVGELANLAAQGDREAEKAVKIIKQARKKGEKYDDKP